MKSFLRPDIRILLMLTAPLKLKLQIFVRRPQGLAARTLTCVGNFLNNRQPIALTYLAFVIKISQPTAPPPPSRAGGLRGGGVLSRKEGTGPPQVECGCGRHRLGKESQWKEVFMSVKRPAHMRLVMTPTKWTHYAPDTRKIELFKRLWRRRICWHCVPKF